MTFEKQLRNMALPDPNDERPVLHAEFYKAVANELAELTRQRDYYKSRLQTIRALFEEARDAICAIPVNTAKFMDAVGIQPEQNDEK